MNEKKEKSLKKIVEYNQELINNANGNIDEVIDELITIEYEGYNIWNPLRDVSMRFEVDPIETYGKNNINKFLDQYNSLS